jgi:hypothetical protein
VARGYFELHPIRVTSVAHDHGVDEWRLVQRLLGNLPSSPASAEAESKPAAATAESEE